VSSSQCTRPARDAGELEHRQIIPRRCSRAAMTSRTSTCRAAASTLAAARQTGASRGSRGLCSRGLCSHWDLWPSCILTVAVVPLAGDGGSATYSARRPVSARGRRGTRASWRYDEQPSGGEHGRGIERSCGPTPPSHRARETRGMSASSTVAVCTRSAESAHTPPDAVLSDQQSSI
jgi:hypothetical protein